MRSQKRVSIAETTNGDGVRGSRRKYSHSALDNRENRYISPAHDSSLRKTPTQMNKNDPANVKVELVP
jgi:hypothetical protein